MKRAFILLVSAILSLTASLAAAQPANQPKPPSADEQKAALAIAAAPDAAAKMKAATDFVKKYPKSVLRVRVARGVADQISAVTDSAQKITFAQTYQQAFTEASEQELILPVLIEALSQAKRADEAFAAGAGFLAKSPDSIVILIQLLATAADEAKKENRKFAAQGIQYGRHAIELIDAGKKPADVDDATWAKYKTDTVPSLYQSLGLLSLVTGNRADAAGFYTKAAELAPTDGFNALMLAGMLVEDYQTQAKHYQSLPNGPAKDEELKKTQALLDKVIDSTARAIALSEGNPAYAQARQQYLQDLEAYYKYRHNGSTAGMQELINKFKPAPKP